MYVLIDNYDSFTYNLVHFFGELGAGFDVIRNDAETADAILGRQPRAIVLSPGPCDPDRAGICLDLIAAAANSVPIMGVCLGHQAIGQAFGGTVVRAPVPVHGKLSIVRHDGKGLFAGLDRSLQATRYHSLTVDRASLPDCLEITAETDDGLVMGLRHRDRPIEGVQFHPESIASGGGHRMLANFLALAGHTVPEPAMITTAESRLLAGSIGGGLAGGGLAGGGLAGGGLAGGGLDGVA